MVIPFTKSKLSSHFVYYNTLNISLSFYFSLIRKKSVTSSVRSLFKYSFLHIISYPNANKPPLLMIRFSITYPRAVFYSLKSSIIVSSCYHIRRFIICAAIVIINRITYFIIVYPNHSINVIFPGL